MKGLLSVVAAVAASWFLAPAAQAYEAAGVADAGKVTGKVTFKGSVPAPRRIPITKNPEVCGTGQREVVEVAVNGDALQNAVVYIARIDKGKAWGELDKPVLNQKGCRFRPDVLVVRKDAELTVRNSDPVMHNIHTYELIGSVRRSIFNVGQPDKGDIKQSVKMRRSNIVKIECDAHDFMHAWAFAADNPYAVETSENGTFTLDNLPAGTYEIKAWHPVLGEKSTTVTVKGGAATTASFDFSK